MAVFPKLTISPNPVLSAVKYVFPVGSNVDLIAPATVNKLPSNVKLASETAAPAPLEVNTSLFEPGIVAEPDVPAVPAPPDVPVVPDEPAVPDVPEVPEVSNKALSFLTLNVML